MEQFYYGRAEILMTEEEKAGKQPFNATINRICRRFNIAPIVFMVALAVFLVLAFSSLSLGIRAMITSKSRTTDFGLKNIGELATQAGYFTNVQMINQSRQLFGADIPLTQSKYVFSYDGIVKAGIDFESIQLNADENSHTIKVKLPEVKILSYEVEPNSLEVYDETSSIFTPLDISKVNISLIEMKEEVLKKATENGILENARANAETIIKGFLAASFDMKKYSIEFE